MKIITKKEIKALLIAPLTAAPIIIISIIISGMILEPETFLLGPGLSLIVIPISIIYFLIPCMFLTYPISFIIGVPLLIIRRIFRFSNIWIMRISGLPIGMLIGDKIPKIPSEQLLYSWLVFGITGLAVTATAVYIMEDEIKNNNVKNPST